jgi:PTS system nitrogen regulatory IIA component
LCRIEAYIKKELVHCKVPIKTKDGLFRYLSDIVEEVAGVSSETVLESIQERESFGSTGIGHGVAIPHGRIPGCREVVIHVLTLSGKIPYGSIDGEGVSLVFMLAVPEGNNLLYLKLLSRISIICNDSSIRDMLINAKSQEEMIRIIKEVP